METTLQVLTDVSAFVFQASIKGTVLIALVLLLQELLSPLLSANGRYMLWLTVIISLATPVGFDIALPNLFAVADFETMHPQQSDTAIAPLSENPSGPMDSRAEPTIFEARGFPWQTALALAWLAGVVAVFFMMGIATRRFSLLVANGEPAPQPLQHLLQTCRQEAGCRTQVRLLQVCGPRAPVLTGVFRPTLLWPTGLEQHLTPAQLRHVFMHELMHVQRRDALCACVVALLQALHWFNPAVWIAFSSLRHDREMACDAATLQRLEPSEAQDYAHTLVELGALLPQASTPLPGLSVLDEPARMRSRIHMLLRRPSRPALRVSLTAISFLTLGTLAFGRPGTVTGPASIPVIIEMPALVEAPAPALPRPASSDVEYLEPVTAPELRPAPTPREPGAAEPLARSIPVAEVQVPTDIVEPAAVEVAFVDTTSSTILAAPSMAEQTPATLIPLYPRPPADPATTDNPEHITCRSFPIAAGRWHICDNTAAWEEFARQLRIEPENFQESTAAHEVASAVTLAQEVCQYRERPGSFIKMRICDSAAGWVANDRIVRPTGLPATQFLEGVQTHARHTPPARP